MFRIAEDLASLLAQCLSVLAEGGKILIATNYENWTRAEFREELQNLSQRRGLKVSETFLPDLDFEMPGEEPIMKSFFVSKL